MVEKNPELFHAYLGVSQLVTLSTSEQRSLELCRNLARRQRCTTALRALPLVAPDPGTETDLLAYVGLQRTWLAKLGGLYHSGRKVEPNMLFLGALFSPDYSFSDVLKLKRGLEFSVRTLWEEILGLDLQAEEARFDVPVFLLLGASDTIASPELIRQYYDRIQAPRKELIEFGSSGHSPQVEEWERYQQTVIRVFAN